MQLATFSDALHGNAIIRLNYKRASCSTWIFALVLKYNIANCLMPASFFHDRDSYVRVKELQQLFDTFVLTFSWYIDKNKLNQCWIERFFPCVQNLRKAFGSLQEVTRDDRRLSSASVSSDESQAASDSGLELSTQTKTEKSAEVCVLLKYLSAS